MSHPLYPSAKPFAVIFDFDGIIIDSETPEYESHRSIFEECGAALSVDEWCGQVGMWTANSAWWFERLRERAAEPPDHATFEASKQQRFRALVKMEPLPGIERLLEQLSGARVRLAIASSAPDRWVRRAVRELGLHAHFDTIVTGNEVDRVKPEPDVYLEAARRLMVPPRRAVAIEDSAPGLAAARAAGMRSVVIPHHLTERQDLSGADLRAQDASELTVEALRALVDRD